MKKPSKKNQQPYRIIPEGSAEWVIVQCPNGHLNRGLKSGNIKVAQRIVCANTKCNAQWSVVLPPTNGFEEVLP